MTPTEMKAEIKRLKAKVNALIAERNELRASVAQTTKDHENLLHDYHLTAQALKDAQRVNNESLPFADTYDSVTPPPTASTLLISHGVRILGDIFDLLDARLGVAMPNNAEVAALSQDAHNDWPAPVDGLDFDNNADDDEYANERAADNLTDIYIEEDGPPLVQLDSEADDLVDMLVDGEFEENHESLRTAQLRAEHDAIADMQDTGEDDDDQDDLTETEEDSPSAVIFQLVKQAVDDDEDGAIQAVVDAHYSGVSTRDQAVRAGLAIIFEAEMAGQIMDDYPLKVSAAKALGLS